MAPVFGRVRGIIAPSIFAMIIPLSGSVYAPDIAFALDRDAGVKSEDTSIGSEDDDPDVFIVTAEYSISPKSETVREGPVMVLDDPVAVERRRVAHKHGKRRHTGRQPANRVAAEKNGVWVYMYPTLGIRDHNTWEEVRGRVEANTRNVSASNVRRMRIGGALLHGTNCSNTYDDPNPVPVSKTLHEVTSGRTQWTDWNLGYDYCWMQTGHNYFVIFVPQKWDAYINGDVYYNLR